MGDGRRSGADTRETNAPRPPPPSSHSSTFWAHGADKQLRLAPGPRGRSQHWQAPRGALAHEQSHLAPEPTLMQPEPASRLRARAPPRPAARYLGKWSSRSARRPRPAPGAWTTDPSMHRLRNRKR